MGLNNGAKNVALDAIGAANLYASLHTGFPATTANELTGGSPAYARKAITWAAASNGSKEVNGTLPVFDVPAGVTVMAVGFCASGVKGTNDINADDDITNETFNGQGTYTVSSAGISM